MAYEFSMPDLGEGVAEGEIVRWLVAEGDEVAEDQTCWSRSRPTRRPSRCRRRRPGWSRRILVEEGDIVPVGELLVVIGSEAASGPRHPRP